VAAAANVDAAMAFLIAPSQTGVTTPISLSADVSVSAAITTNSTTTTAITLSAAATVSPSITATEVTNDWDPPAADQTNNMTTWSVSALNTAIAASKTYHASNPTGVYRINASAGSTFATLSSSINIRPDGPLIIDFVDRGFTQSGATNLFATGDYYWKEEVTVSVSGGNTTVTPLDGGAFPSPLPEANDVLLTFSNHRFYGDISSGRRQGELMSVLSRSGNLVTYSGDLRYRVAPADRGGNAFGAADRPFVAKMNINRRLWLLNCKINGDPVQVVRLLDIRSLYKPAIINATLVVNGNIPGGLINCYSAYIIDPLISEAPNTGFTLQHNKNTLVKGVTITQNNFLNTETGPDPNSTNPGVTSQAASLTQLQFWGPEIDALCENINCQEAQVGAGPASMGSHSGSDGYIHRNCTAINIPGAVTTIFGGWRGKRSTVDGGTFTRRAGFQPYAYPSNITSNNGPDYAPYRDGSDCTLKNATININGSGGTGAFWIGPNPPQAFTYCDNLQLIDNIWNISNTSGKFNFSQCGTAFVTRDIVKPTVNVTTVYNLTRPTIVTGTTAKTDLTFTDAVIDLSGHPNSGTLTIVSIPNECIARGTISVINRPASLTVVGKTTSGNGDGSGLTITVS